MEQKYITPEIIYQDDQGMALTTKANVGLEEDNQSSCTSSEVTLELNITKKIPPIFDVKPESTLRCLQQSCPCDKSSSAEYTSSLSASKDLAQHSTDSAELGASNSLGIFRRTSSFFSIPMSLRSTEFFFESLKHQSKAKNVNDLAEFIIDYSVAKHPGNVIIGASGQCIFGSIEGNVLARALLKRSLFFQFGSLHGTVSQVRSRSINARQKINSELESYPSLLCNTLSGKPKSEEIPFVKQISKVHISEEMLVSCSSTNSTRSCQSTSSAHCSFSQGMLRLLWKNGIPYFVFSVDDSQSEVYVANPQKVDSSADKTLDCMYLFHSKTHSKTHCRNHENNRLRVVGRMKVSSSLILNSNKSRFMETEFILFGALEDHSREMQNSTSTQTKSKGLSKKLSEIFRSSYSFRHRSTSKVGDQSSRLEELLEETFVCELVDIDKSGPPVTDFQPNLELAAIVVKDNQHFTNKKLGVGGWGLNFLEKIETDQADTSLKPSLSSKSWDTSCIGNRRESMMSMNVIVPAGFHGGPVSNIGGPSSLTERWTSGGHCDCGGWDSGCPLTVLNNSFNSEVSPNYIHEDYTTVNLFTKGVKNGEPILRMVNTSEGIYNIYFQSPLSALQSFSVGVAIIHTQTLDIYPKLLTSVEEI